MSEGPSQTPEFGPSIPPRDLDALARIVHDTRVEIAADERFKAAFTRQVLKKHLEPRQYHRIRQRAIAGVASKLQANAPEEWRTLERFRYERLGKPVTIASPYAYTARAQEDILRATIALLSNPPSRLDRHPEGFQEAWLQLALKKMRETH